MTETVAILGASKDERRYARQAQLLLISKGHKVIPINPKYDVIDGIACYPSISAYKDEIDTLTVYVRPFIFLELIGEVISAAPNRIIFNPGTSDSAIIEKIKDSNIIFEMACSLVLLNTSQF